jgi:RNA polymerase sigma-70 factor (ECF subfamily)
MIAISFAHGRRPDAASAGSRPVARSEGRPRRGIGAAAMMAGPERETVNAPKDMPDTHSDPEGRPETPAVLQRIAAGEPGATRECLDVYGNLIWSVARRHLGHGPDTEDAVQEICIELWKHAGRFDPAKGSEVQFISTIARRRVVDGLRRRGRRPDTEPLDESQRDDSEGVGDAAERADEVHRAQTAMQQLPPERQAVLRMALLAGRSHSEIAAQTSMPLGTVKTHVRRGLIRMRELLGEPPAR